jgi:hypothetical protein
MSNVPASGRSFATISRADLERLRAIGERDLEMRFARRPRWQRLYSERRIAVALCQGAALHFVSGERGINDFDVWTFFAEHAEAPFPPRWRTEHDFGDPKFGQSVDKPGFVGRRVDCIGRSFPCSADEDPWRALHQYLGTPRTATARLLAQRPVVLLEPATRLGEIVWQPASMRTAG